eukprot:Hpha_TRINITY_DN16459_c1_g9::TRINITY_DN16459_c1_g9_i1::g.162873::m.162873
MDSISDSGTAVSSGSVSALSARRPVKVARNPRKKGRRLLRGGARRRALQELKEGRTVTRAAEGLVLDGTWATVPAALDWVVRQQCAWAAHRPHCAPCGCGIRSTRRATPSPVPSVEVQGEALRGLHSGSSGLPPTSRFLVTEWLANPQRPPPLPPWSVQLAGSLFATLTDSAPSGAFEEPVRQGAPIFATVPVGVDAPPAAERFDYVDKLTKGQADAMAHCNLDPSSSPDEPWPAWSTARQRPPTPPYFFLTRLVRASERYWGLWIVDFPGTAKWVCQGFGRAQLVGFSPASDWSVPPRTSWITLHVTVHPRIIVSGVPEKWPHYGARVFDRSSKEFGVVSSRSITPGEGVTVQSLNSGAKARKAAASLCPGLPPVTSSPERVANFLVEHVQHGDTQTPLQERVLKALWESSDVAGATTTQDLLPGTLVQQLVPSAERTILSSSLEMPAPDDYGYEDVVALAKVVPESATLCVLKNSPYRSLCCTRLDSLVRFRNELYSVKGICGARVNACEVPEAQTRWNAPGILSECCSQQCHRSWAPKQEPPWSQAWVTGHSRYRFRATVRYTIETGEFGEGVQCTSLETELPASVFVDQQCQCMSLFVGDKMIAVGSEVTVRHGAVGVLSITGGGEAPAGKGTVRAVDTDSAFSCLVEAESGAAAWYKQVDLQERATLMNWLTDLKGLVPGKDFDPGGKVLHVISVRDQAEFVLPVELCEIADPDVFLQLEHALGREGSGAKDEGPRQQPAGDLSTEEVVPPWACIRDPLLANATAARACPPGSMVRVGDEVQFSGKVVGRDRTGGGRLQVRTERDGCVDEESFVDARLARPFRPAKRLEEFAVDNVSVVLLGGNALAVADVVRSFDVLSVEGVPPAHSPIGEAVLFGLRQVLRLAGGAVFAKDLPGGRWLLVVGSGMGGEAKATLEGLNLENFSSRHMELALRTMKPLERRGRLFLAHAGGCAAVLAPNRANRSRGLDRLRRVQHTREFLLRVPATDAPVIQSHRKDLERVCLARVLVSRGCLVHVIGTPLQAERVRVCVDRLLRHHWKVTQQLRTQKAVRQAAADASATRIRIPVGPRARRLLGEGSDETDVVEPLEESVPPETLADARKERFRTRAIIDRKVSADLMACGVPAPPGGGKPTCCDALMVQYTVGRAGRECDRCPREAVWRCETCSSDVCRTHGGMGELVLVDEDEDEQSSRHALRAAARATLSHLSRGNGTVTAGVLMQAWAAGAAIGTEDTRWEDPASVRSGLEEYLQTISADPSVIDEEALCGILVSYQLGFPYDLQQVVPGWLAQVTVAESRHRLSRPYSQEAGPTEPPLPVPEGALLARRLREHMQAVLNYSDCAAHCKVLWAAAVEQQRQQRRGPLRFRLEQLDSLKAGVDEVYTLMAKRLLQEEKEASETLRLLSTTKEAAGLGEEEEEEDCPSEAGSEAKGWGGGGIGGGVWGGPGGGGRGGGGEGRLPFRG